MVIKSLAFLNFQLTNISVFQPIQKPVISLTSLELTARILAFDLIWVDFGQINEYSRRYVSQ